MINYNSILNSLLLETVLVCMIPALAVVAAFIKKDTCNGKIRFRLRKIKEIEKIVWFISIPISIMIIWFLSITILDYAKQDFLHGEGKIIGISSGKSFFTERITIGNETYNIPRKISLNAKASSKIGSNCEFKFTKRRKVILEIANH